MVHIHSTFQLLITVSKGFLFPFLIQLFFLGNLISVLFELSEKVAALLGNITFWHDNRGVCWGTEVSACGKVGCLQTKIALSQFSLCVPVSSMRGKNKEIGGCDRKGELDSEV